MKASVWIPLLLMAAATTSFSTGCGGGSSIAANAPPPPPSNLSIAFDSAPPTSLSIISTATISAVVQNDSSNAGVDWSLTCQNSGNCGSLSSPHTGSGESMTYTPPTTLPQNSQPVNIVAFATTDHTKNVLAQFTVSAFGSVLNGTYVMQTRGVDLTGLPYQFAGVVVLDGNGVITSGQQTYSNYTMSTTDSITGGSCFVGPDGRGTMTITTSNQLLGQQGVETFSLVVLSNSQALIARMDDPSLPTLSNETAQGTLDLQTSTAAPIAGYAFAVSGIDVATLSPTAFGGILNIDSPGSISGAGSVADQDVGGSVTTNSTVSGTVSAPDSLGVVKFTLTPGFSSIPIEFKGYMVDATHIKLIESDNTSGTGFASTAGIAIGQGSATGTFIGPSSFSGVHVFAILGQDLSGLPSSLTAAGLFGADGAGHFAHGLVEEFFGGLNFQIRDQFHGTYSVDASGNGRVDASLHFLHNGPGPEFIFYLTGNGNPALILDADTIIGSLGAGAAYPAAAPPISFNGSYGVSYTQSVFGSENDATGQFTADSTSLTLSGAVDTNFFFTPIPGTPLTGDFIPGNGNRMSGTLANQLFPASLAVSYYMIDSSHGFFVENDFRSTFQLTFGYVSTRTPVCQGCP